MPSRINPLSCRTEGLLSLFSWPDTKVILHSCPEILQCFLIGALTLEVSLQYFWNTLLPSAASPIPQSLNLDLALNQ